MKQQRLIVLTYWKTNIGILCPCQVQNANVPASCRCWKYFKIQYPHVLNVIYKIFSAIYRNVTCKMFLCVIATSRRRYTPKKQTNKKTWLVATVDVPPEDVQSFFLRHFIQQLGWSSSRGVDIGEKLESWIIKTLLLFAAAKLWYSIIVPPLAQNTTLVEQVDLLEKAVRPSCFRFHPFFQNCVFFSIKQRTICRPRWWRLMLYICRLFCGAHWWRSASFKPAVSLFVVIVVLTYYYDMSSRDPFTVTHSYCTERSAAFITQYWGIFF